MAVTQPRNIPEWTLGDRLTKARETGRDGTEIPVPEMAELMGRKTSTIYAWENDERTPSFAKINLWAEICGVDPVWLAYGYDGNQTTGRLPASAALPAQMQLPLMSAIAA